MITLSRTPPKREKRKEGSKRSVKLWTCPNCKRQFEKKGQSHSCRLFPIEQHFERKEHGKLLYDRLRVALKKRIGPFKVESLACCIHFVSKFTFAAVRVYKQKLLLDFATAERIQSPRIKKCIPLSSQRHLHYVQITKETEIDNELVDWLTEARNKGPQG